MVCVSFDTNENIEAPQPVWNEIKCDVAVGKQLLVNLSDVYVVFLLY